MLNTEKKEEGENKGQAKPVFFKVITMKLYLSREWNNIIKKVIQKNYFNNIYRQLKIGYKNKDIYPARQDIFKSLNSLTYDDIKVVILGQDPYHGENQANGLAFSVNNGVKLPPSLKNIFKEIKRDMGGNIAENGDLSYWANQGVLLLNTILTVEKGKPYSHKRLGWQNFTNNIIKLVNKKESPVVFMLWGNHAKQYKKLLTNKIHLILETSHPSPFSFYKGFYGCSHFSKANIFLSDNNITKIDWNTTKP